MVSIFIEQTFLNVSYLWQHSHYSLNYLAWFYFFCRKEVIVRADILHLTIDRKYIFVVYIFKAIYLENIAIFCRKLFEKHTSL